MHKEIQKMNAATQKILTYLPRMRAPRLIRKEFFYAWATLLVILPIFSLCFNLFLNFYLAVPETDRFLKIASTNGIISVHENVNEIIEKEKAIQLSQINPQAVWVATVVNQVAGQPDPLSVQGSTSALGVHTQIGEVSAEPIYFTSAYLKGVTSAYEIGSQYYDLDFNLYVDGVGKSLIVSQVGQEHATEINLFKASLGLVQQTDEVLKIDLNSFLNKSTDRESALRSYLIYMQNLETALEGSATKLEREVDYWEAEEKSARNQMEDSEEDFFVALNKFDQNTSYDELIRFIEENQETVDKKANLQAMRQLQKYVQAYTPVLSERIEAVVANRYPLVHGVKVVAFREVDLGLIEAGD